MNMIKLWLGFDNMLVVESVGKGGGLVLLWKEGWGIEIQNYSNRHINAVVSPTNSTPWVFTGFYGHPEAHKRVEAWSLLRHLKSLVLVPWLCAGDFNEILDHSEKIGGRRRPNFLMDNFKSTLEFCDLHEVECRGPRCTWNNGREGINFTMEKLDRVFANHEWLTRYPKVEISLEGAIFSDHLPILINMAGSKVMRRKGRGFRYEATWAEKKECKEIIKKIWKVKDTACGTWSSVNMKLNESKRGLEMWQKVHGRKVGQHIQMLSDKLLEEKAKQDDVDSNLIKKLHEELIEKQNEEDVYWRQRAKEDWLKHGDQNSRYFHASANQKKKASMMTEIMDEQGNKWETEELIGDAFAKYFQGLFTTSGLRQMESVLEKVDRRATSDMNNALLKEFMVEEIGVALNQMAPLKAPGPDGFSASFFQKNWAVIGDEVSRVVLYFLNNGVLNKELNLTYIALIPKVANPSCVTEFRPISLCNVLYKLVAKTLANRLKLVLNDIISPNQSAFVPDRLISDNILAAYETLHTMQSRMWGKVGYMAVKLDMSKAYDRVEWDFLEAIMCRLGFVER
jgi:hypothetical protein